MVAGLVRQAGGINRWNHIRGPVPIDRASSRGRDGLYRQ